MQHWDRPVDDVIVTNRVYGEEGIVLFPYQLPRQEAWCSNCIHNHLTQVLLIGKLIHRQQNKMLNNVCTPSLYGFQLICTTNHYKPLQTTTNVELFWTNRHTYEWVRTTMNHQVLVTLNSYKLQWWQNVYKTSTILDGAFLLCSYCNTITCHDFNLLIIACTQALFCPLAELLWYLN